GLLLAQAAQRHLPILTLDGSIMQLTEARVEGSVQVQAKVEFAVRREQTLKGTLSGAATTFGSGPGLSDQGRRQLQDDAVDGAVQSALRGADQGLLVAGL
ncbi:MAG: HEAT repeat domain-containing protein, partial [Polyangiaceae bacterium]